MKQGLEILPELASELRSYKHLHFVFCGDGAYRPELEEAIAGFENVSFLPLQPVEKFNELLNMADIHLLPQKAGAADLVMPSKLTGMLASGRPIIATAAPGTQVARAIEGHGLAIAPGDSRAFVEAIIALADDAPLRRNMGLAARSFAEQELARDSVLLRFESAIERMFDDTAVTTVAENSAL
jgi:colanic acid biosynthesis glycosyl transferase WcaI